MKNLVKESIEFKRGQEQSITKSLDIGKNSTYMKKVRMEELKDKLKFINEESIENVINNIDEFEEDFKNIKAVGIDLSKIGISTWSKWSLPQYRIVIGNNVRNQCLLEDDANTLLYKIYKYDINIEQQQFFVELDTFKFYIKHEQLQEYWKRRGWTWLK